MIVAAIYVGIENRILSHLVFMSIHMDKSLRIEINGTY